LFLSGEGYALLKLLARKFKKLLYFALWAEEPIKETLSERVSLGFSLCRVKLGAGRLRIGPEKEQL